MTQGKLFTGNADKDYQIRSEMELIDTDWNIPTEFPDLSGSCR